MASIHKQAGNVHDTEKARLAAFTIMDAAFVAQAMFMPPCPRPPLTIDFSIPADAETAFPLSCVLRLCKVSGGAGREDTKVFATEKSAIWSKHLA